MLLMQIFVHLDISLGRERVENATEDQISVSISIEKSPMCLSEDTPGYSGFPSKSSNKSLRGREGCISSLSLWNSPKCFELLL